MDYETARPFLIAVGGPLVIGLFKIVERVMHPPTDKPKQAPTTPQRD